MARSNVDAIYAEYPFLSTFRPRDKVVDAKVRRWDDNFLNTCTDNIHLLDEHGEAVVSPPSVWHDIGKILLFSLTLKSIEKSVDEMLQRLSEKELRRVKYAVGFYSAEGLILWKLPPGCKNAAEWQLQRTQKARQKFREA